MTGRTSGTKHLQIIEPNKRPRKNRESVVYAKVGKEISFVPDILDTYHHQGWKAVHHDLLLVSAAVEYADRYYGRGISRWGRDISVSIPVLDISIWRSDDVQGALRSLLCHLTGDRWTLSFSEWKGSHPNTQGQRFLPLSAQHDFVTAYSDGLDSRCVASIFGGDDKVLCVRVSSSNSKPRHGDTPFEQIPFRVSVDKKNQESSRRTRGFKFAAVTAIAAHLSGTRKILVPESGQGALGPVLQPLYRVYPDYRNHPIHFRRMETFTSLLLDFNVQYIHPRLWSTKGQTIKAYLAGDGDMSKIIKTRSCWQTRFNVKSKGRLRQCGLCAACLLRRMSIHASGISEPNGTYIIDDLSAPRYHRAVESKDVTDSMADHGNAAVRHLQSLAQMAEMPTEKMSADIHQLRLALGSQGDHDIEDMLREMLKSHAGEWSAFLRSQGKNSFLNKWSAEVKHA